MSLTTRVSAFFLLALAVVLAGFSGTLYLLARTYLVRQLDERLQRALDTLEASVDIEPGGLEWEPADRKMELGVDTGITAVRWAVRDGRARPRRPLGERSPREAAGRRVPRRVVAIALAARPDGRDGLRRLAGLAPGGTSAPARRPPASGPRPSRRRAGI